MNTSQNGISFLKKKNTLVPGFEKKNFKQFIISKIQKNILVLIIIFTNPSARAEYDTRSIS